MKTEFEKMRSRELYCYFDPEIDRSIRHADKACFRFNRTSMEDPDYRPALEEMIPGIPTSTVIAPPSTATTVTASIWAKMSSSISML